MRADGCISSQREGRKSWWKPGQSGNPKGRPPLLTEANAKMREALSGKISIDELATMWIDMAQDKKFPPSVRLAALTWISERLCGKAEVQIDLHDSEAEARRIEARERLKKLLAAEAPDQATESDPQKDNP